MARLISKQDLIPMLWKNSGGTTSEIAIAPEGANLAQFDWRVSLATITKSGAFSGFPGIDRSLTLVDGEGVDIYFNDRPPFNLCARDPVLQFSGEAQVMAVVERGATTDFNVMTRRAVYHHKLERLIISDRFYFWRKSGTTLLFVAEGKNVSCKSQGIQFDLHQSDALLCDADDPVMWILEPQEKVNLFIVDIIESDV